MKIFNIFKKSCLFIAFIANFISCNFTSGSYPFAEKYELNSSEEKVKIAINKFKLENPEYLVPKVTIDDKTAWDLIDEQSKEPSHWFIVYFYYPIENKIILTWTRPAENGKTTFAFVSINQSLKLGNWREINKDFSHSENILEKKKFEEKIFNKIKAML